MPKVTDGAPDDGWLIDDELVRLRPLAGGRPLELPRGGEAPGTEIVIGAEDSCEFVLVDPSNRVSRRHAKLYHDGNGWWMQDLGSTNGVREDGERRLLFQVTPGIEITLGDVALVAESEQLLALRELLARLISWDAARGADIDRAVPAVRELALRRKALVLWGAGELTSIAQRLHAVTLGSARPFVTPAPDESLMAALERAGTGTLCLPRRATADELGALRGALEAIGARGRVIACTTSRQAALEAVHALGRASIVELPAINTRQHELERLLRAFAEDAARTLGAPSTGFRVHEMNWLGKIEYRDFEFMEYVVERVVALRNWSVGGAAKRFGVSSPAMSQWAQRYGIPT